MTGSPVSGGRIANSSTATQLLQRLGELSVWCDATVRDTDTKDGPSAGDTIEYKIRLNNTGSTTLKSISVTSTLLLGQFDRWVPLFARGKFTVARFLQPLGSWHKNSNRGSQCRRRFKDCELLYCGARSSYQAMSGNTRSPQARGNDSMRADAWDHQDEHGWVGCLELTDRTCFMSNRHEATQHLVVRSAVNLPRTFYAGPSCSNWNLLLAEVSIVLRRTRQV